MIRIGFQGYRPRQGSDTLRLHFRGFSYTAYLKSDYISTLDQQGLLETGDLAPDVRTLLGSMLRDSERFGELAARIYVILTKSS